MSAPFKILSIDGGGIKGLYSASVLACIEEKTGKKCGDHFDMICGTSTGGLIALALACGKPAKDLVDLYEKQGNKIFPVSNYQAIRYFQMKWRTIRQTLFWGKFSNKGLRSILEATFSDKTLGELNNLVCIPSFNLVSGQPRMFKFPHKEGGFFMDKNIRIVDAALATSAAPTFLPIHEHNNALYVDGGVWANNPSLCGLLEALKHFVAPEEKEYKTFEILSISSVSQASGWPSGVRKNRSFIGWKSKLFQTSMDGQAYFTHFFLDNLATRLSPDARYVRIESPKLSLEQLKLIEMDRADKKAIKTLRELGDRAGYTHALNPQILRFFDHPKTYNTK